jgi:hypothetical protein
MDTYDNTFLPDPDTNINAPYEPNRWYSIGQLIPLTHEHIRMMYASATYLCTFGDYWNTYNDAYPLTVTGDTFRVGVETYKITQGPVMFGKRRAYIYTQWRTGIGNQNEFPSGLTGSQRYNIRSASARLYMEAFTYYARDAFVTMLSKRTIILDLAAAVPNAIYKECMRACTTSVASVLTKYENEDLIDYAIRKQVPSLKGIKRKDVAKLCMRAREGFVAMWRYNDDATKNTYLAWLPLDVIKIIAALCIDAPSLQ